MYFEQLLDRPGAWLRSNGDDADVVVSSRIRLARNISGFSFVGHASDADLDRIVDRVAQTAKEVLPEDSYYLLRSTESTREERELFCERRLCGESFWQNPKGAIIVDKNEDFSITALEEDHLRIQTTGGGFCLRELWKKVDDLDDRFEEKLHFSFDDHFGYLTTSPDNTGTGMRVSTILHLPGLMETGEIIKVFRSLEKVNLEVRGRTDVQKRPLGNFFCIGNRSSLGASEESMIDSLAEVVSCVVEYERKARKIVFEEDREGTLDRCFRALGVLKTARVVSFEDAERCLGNLRLAVHMDLFHSLDEIRVNRLLQGVETRHLLEKAERQGYAPDDEGVLRADYLREELANVD